MCQSGDERRRAFDRETRRIYLLSTPRAATSTRFKTHRAALAATGGPRPVVRDRRSATGGSRKKQSQYNPSTFHHAPPTIPQIKTFATPMIPPSLNVVGKSTNPAPKYTAPCPEA